MPDHDQGATALATLDPHELAPLAAELPPRMLPDGTWLTLPDLLADIAQRGMLLYWDAGGGQWRLTRPAIGSGCAFADRHAFDEWYAGRFKPLRADWERVVASLPAPGGAAAVRPVTDVTPGPVPGPAAAPPPTAPTATLPSPVSPVPDTVAPPAPVPPVSVGWAPPPHEVVADGERMRQLLGELRHRPRVGVDTETLALDPHDSLVRLVQIATADRVYILDLFQAGPLELQRAVLLDWLADPSAKVLFNAKFDLQHLRAELGGPAAGPLPAVRVHDLMLWDQLLACGRDVGSHALAAVARRHLGVAVSKEEQTSDWAALQLTEEQLEYAARDAAVLVPLADILERKLAAEGLARPAAIEDGCVHAVADMEFAGTGFDADYWAALTAEIRGAAEAAAARAHELLPAPAAQRVPAQAQSLFGDLEGEGAVELNLNSPQQVAAALGEIGIPVPSTADAVLAPLAREHEAVAALLRYRKLAKLLSGFCDALPGFVNRHTGRIHAHYQQINRNGVGRFSCREPNIQQTPHDPRFRRAFVARPGRKLVIADYSQIELRIMAKLSGDKRMTDAYVEGVDLHRLTASLASGVPIDQVTKDQRQQSKPINFGFIYGMGANTFRAYAANSYGVSFTQEEAEAFRSKFFTAYPGVAAYHRRQDAEARRARCAVTLSGRKRKWASTDMPLTELVNTPDQGSGADILKCAMARIRPHLVAAQADMAISVHDELVLECPAERAEEIAEVLRREMVAAGAEFVDPVPVEVEVAIGDTWADKQ